MLKRIILLWSIVIVMFAAGNLRSWAVQNDTGAVRLAYVHNGVVTLADAEGMPIATPGPTFQSGQSANLFWSEDGERLYIARRDGLFVTGPGSESSTRLPGNYGLTMIFDRSNEVIYYMESGNPQPTDNPELITFPLREINTQQAQGETGRLVGYIGEYQAGSSEAAITAAALQYARDGGLLATGRPRLFPTYGATMFYSCCFPNPGLNAIDLPSGDKRPYDTQIIPGPAALNSVRSRLAAPVLSGSIRLIDLVSAGIRDYEANVGTIERIVWALDDSAVYLIARQPPNNPLELNPIVTAVIDTQSANIVVWRLNLVTGQLRELAQLGDFYGVPSVAATHDYLFVVAVERNTRLVEDLNAGRLPPDLDPMDPRLLTDYLPSTILFRIKPDGTEALSIMTDVWGVAARPRR